MGLLLAVATEAAAPRSAMPRMAAPRTLVVQTVATWIESYLAELQGTVSEVAMVGMEAEEVTEDALGCRENLRW